MIQLGVSMPAFHTISYTGSLTTTVKLHFQPIPSVFEYLTVNESTVIKNTPGTFQRNIAIDANEERLSISFNVRKFVGATDFCNYGGIRMFNHLNASLSYHHTHRFIQAHIPYAKIKHNGMPSLKKSIYAPICTNDSFIFERKFYLDFGTTYIVFYDFNSMWSIDLTLNVHPSKYNAIFNFQHTYCNEVAKVYKFRDFFIHCTLTLVRLTEQVPLILQWPRNSYRAGKHASENTECVWPGIMDLTINHNYRNLRIFNKEMKLCSPTSLLHITTLYNITTVLLDKNIQNHSVSNAESFMLVTTFSNCRFMEQSSYAIILTHFSGDNRCSSSRNAFTISDDSDKTTNHKKITDQCISFDVTMRMGMYAFYFMEPFFNILYQDQWIYYSIIISEGCYRGAGVKVYFQNRFVKSSRIVHFKFTQHKYHYIWYGYGIMGVLMIHLKRILLECSAYIEMTSAPKKPEIWIYRQSIYQVPKIF